MPKPRLSRHLFGTYAVALVIVLASCYWLSAVRIAAVTEEAEFKRMKTTAVGLADLLDGGGAAALVKLSPEMRNPNERRRVEAAISRNMDLLRKKRNAAK